MRIQIINGPNINLLGKREPSIYGARSFEDYLKELMECYPQIELEYYQSNVEGEMINKIHEVGFDKDGIILNAGAYTHTSIAILDALKAVGIPTVEVHISDVDSREAFRQISYAGLACEKTIKGHGLKGYKQALIYLTSKYGQ